jgi:hypothetical protein
MARTTLLKISIFSTAANQSRFKAKLTNAPACQEALQTEFGFAGGYCFVKA